MGTPSAAHAGLGILVFLALVGVFLVIKSVFFSKGQDRTPPRSGRPPAAGGDDGDVTPQRPSL